MKRPRNNLIPVVLSTVLLLLILGGVTWGNFNYVRNNPGGNDFLVHWMGTRAILKDGISPYSDEVATRIQTFAYGRPAQPGEHELRVAYPLYSVILFTPFALIDDFPTARAVWMTILEAGLIGLVLVSLRLYRWRVSPLMLGFLVIFSIFWYHGLRPLINGNAVILVALGLAAGFWALRSGADELAGVLFAFTTIKPQVVVLVLAYVAFWGLFQRRWRMLGWMIGTVFLLSVSAALVIPDWMVQNLREVIRYPSYNPPGTPSAAFTAWWPGFGGRVGLALTGVLLVILVVEWWANRKVEMRGFLWVAGLTLTISQWIGIQTDPGNFVVLFPVLMMVFALLDEKWKGRGGLLIIGFCLLLLVVLWAIFLKTVTYNGQPIQSPVMFFPLPAFMFLMLYWVRWWAVRPARLWIEQIDL